jgi:predicted ATPase
MTGTIARLETIDALANGQTFAGAHCLPQSGKRLIGRAELVGCVVARLQKGRLLTLVGYGGVGKTSVALAAATAWERLTQTDVLFIDLSRISEAGSIWTTILATLGVNPLGDPREAVLRLLADRSTLILLDNCEHVVAGLADAALRILEQAPAIRILATSREELRLPDEELYRVQPLSVPEIETDFTAEEIIRHSAVELLLERVREKNPAFELSDSDVDAVARLCRRLDGIPLAIELAAARVAATPIEDVVAQLSLSFEVLADASVPETNRHAGLLAVLDWSYGLLTSAEQAVLRAASVFASDFEGSDVISVMRGTVSPAMIQAALNGLTAKSMAQEVVGGRLRLLESTRAYAQQKLEAVGERDALFDALSIHVRQSLRNVPRDDRQSALALWDRVRSDAGTALDWTLRGQGDPTCGIDIVAAALPTWLLLSEISRYEGEMQAAADAIRKFAPNRRADELQFEFSRSVALYFVRGPNLEGNACGRRAYEIAVATNATERQLDTAWNLHAQISHWGGYEDALFYARRYLATAKRLGDTVFINQGWRVITRAYDDLGFHNRAARLFREIVQPNAGATARPVTAWGADEKIIRICMDARVEWFAGRTDEALGIAARAVEVGEREGQAHTFCWMLAHHMVPLALWAGHMEAAERYVTILEGVARHHFENWTNWAEMLREAIDVIAGSVPSQRLLQRIEESWPFRQELFATLHPSLACDEVLLEAERRNRLCWSTPELFRLIGERAAAAGDVERAKALIQRGNALALDRGNVPGALLIGRSLDRLGMATLPAELRPAA